MYRRYRVGRQPQRRSVSDNIQVEMMSTETPAVWLKFMRTKCIHHVGKTSQNPRSIAPAPLFVPAPVPPPAQPVDPVYDTLLTVDDNEPVSSKRWEASCRRTPGDVSAYDEFGESGPPRRTGHEHEHEQEYEHTSALRVLNLDISSAFDSGAR
jgi:hypothetical protein